MRAHVANNDGLIMNTIIVDQLENGLIDASIGGGIGDSIINGVLELAPILVFQEEEVL